MLSTAENKRLAVLRALAGFPIAFFSAAWLTGLPRFIYTINDSVKPVYWILAAVGWLGMLSLRYQPRLGRAFSRLPIIWGGCYSILLFWQFTQLGDPDHLIINQLEAMLVFFLSAYVFLIERSQHRRARVGMLAGVVVAVTLNVAEYFSPVCCFYPHRASGFNLDPNTSATAITLGLICTWTLVPKSWRPSYLALCGFAVAITYSRGGWVLMALAAAGLLIRDWRTNDEKGQAAGAFIGLTVLLGCAVWLTVHLGHHLSADMETRLAAFGGELDGSAQKRIDAAREAFQHFLQAPLLGYGLGSSRLGAIGPHNMYLLYAAELGIIGLGLYLWFVVRLYVRAHDTAKLLVLVYAVSGLFTHNNFEAIAVMLLLATSTESMRCRSNTGSARLHQTP